MGIIEDVEFQTLDGITLRGRVYHAKKQAPGIVMCPGVRLASFKTIASEIQLSDPFI